MRSPYAGCVLPRPAQRLTGGIGIFAALRIPLAVLDKNLAAEAGFYGALDSAGRFTQRDVVARIPFTTIHIVAGSPIGVFPRDMDLKRALAAYTVLTIRNGVLAVWVAFPGWPPAALLLPGSGVGYAGSILRRKALAGDKCGLSVLPTPTTDNLESVLKVEPLAVEEGFGRQMAADAGYLV